jgi:hypothetical protein
MPDQVTGATLQGLGDDGRQTRGGAHCLSTSGVAGVYADCTREP